jgi:signal transduction histidine kinase
MNTAKSSTTSSNVPDTLGTSTRRFTAPLVLKIVGAFGVMAVLLVALTFFNLFNLNQSKDASQKALDLKTFALSTQRLHEALLSEHDSVLNTVYTGQIDPNLATYQTNFNIAFSDLAARKLPVGPISLAHETLRQLYANIVSAIQAGQTSEARNLWQIADTQAKKLQEMIDVQVQAANNSSIEATKQADQVQSDAVGITLWLALLAFVFIGSVGYFVIVRVLAPLRVLNHNLNQLLWSQTEHLTDRLNQLQAEINTNNDMLTTVRHDLKSPLSSIKNLAELATILQPNLDTDVKENLQKIIETADSSVSTISSVLSRREQHLDLQTVPLEALVDKVLQLMDLRFYSVQRKVEADEWVMDPGLMEHALLNLMSNARKFSMSGVGVGVRKVRKPGTVDTQELELWVWNDGAVINGEDRVEIFKPGKQTAEGKRAGGHGLGLSIVKSIAERHHGRVTVDSHEKIGTTFRIFLPVLTVSEPAPTSKPPLVETASTSDSQLVSY